MDPNKLLLLLIVATAIYGVPLWCALIWKRPRALAIAALLAFGGIGGLLLMMIAPALAFAVALVLFFWPGGATVAEASAEDLTPATQGVAACPKCRAPIATAYLECPSCGERLGAGWSAKTVPGLRVVS